VTHRLRVLAALGGLLSLTVAATWILTGRMALFPLLDELRHERVEAALYLAEQVETAPDPAARAWELSQQLGLRVDPVPDTPAQDSRYRAVRRDDRRVLVGRRPAMPIYVPLQGLPVWGMAVRWPVDIERPRRRVGWGFGLIALVVLAGAVAASGWVLRPLRVTSRAMDQVAGGDLDVRVPEGRDEAGRIGATFNRMAARVASLVRGQRRLMAGVSHELRTPLARMRLLTELLRDEGGSQKRLDALEEQIAAMDGLVGELLESARLEEGVVQLRREQLALAEIVEEALAAVDLGERPLTLDLAPDLQLQADRTRLVRVLTNLLSNVARYTPPSSALQIRAERSSQGSNASVLLELADNGPGVPEADLPQLFDPFYRAEQSRSRSTGGLGLGLMLVRQIVEAHGGQVSARNRPEGGLEVHLELPVSHAPPKSH